MLGFPCNQFGRQEPGTNAEILEFARSRYDVDFPLFAKIEVNGDQAAPLYDWLKQGQPGDVRWNFEKFLVGPQGEVLARWGTRVTPEDIAAELPKFR